jgi:ankyrin repeat protein
MLGWLFNKRKKWNAQLHAAVQAGDIAEVRGALDKGADIDALDNVRRETAIHTSVATENKGLVQLLLSRGANPNVISEQNTTPLIIAANIGDRALPIVELLLAGRADPLQTPKVGPYAGSDVLCVAASKGANGILRHLLSFVPVPRVLANGATLMHMAAIGGDEETIARVIVSGLSVNDVDNLGATPLHYAVSHGNKAAVESLLSHGADPEICNKQHQTAKDLAREINSPMLEIFTRQDKPFGESISEMSTDMAVVESSEHEELAHVRDMSLLEFSNAYFPNVRIKNVLLASTTEGSLPFETVGAYLDAGEEGKQALLKLPNLGLGSISRLDKAIASAMQSPLPIMNEAVETLPVKLQDLADQLETRFPGVFTPLLSEYANTPVSERDYCAALEADMLRLLTDERLAEVAFRRFHGETLADIALSLGVTRERVRQIEKQAKPWMTTPKEPEQLEEVDGEPEMPVPEGLRRKWYEMYLRLQAYQAQHGSADVPNQWPEDPKLAAWVSNQRQKYKKNELTPQQIEMLELLGFSWSLRERGTWDDRLAELVEFKRRHGHFDVPTNYPAAPKLRQFIASTHYQYRTGTLDTDRIMRLEDAGFLLNTGAKTATPSAPSSVADAVASVASLAGRTMTFTGRLETLTQGEATELARKNGAIVVDKFSGSVNLLVVGSEPGSKLADAQRTGVPQINEKQFIALLG